MFVCFYVTLLLLDALHLGRQTSRGSSTTHGRAFYDPTVGSSTTHGRVVSVNFFFSKFTAVLLFLRTVELPLVVIIHTIVRNAMPTVTYNCSQQHVSLLRLCQFA